MSTFFLLYSNCFIHLKSCSGFTKLSFLNDYAIIRTSFEQAGFSIADTKSVLTSIASDCRVEGGDCLNGFEVFWTPSEPTEVLNERDSEYFSVLVFYSFPFKIMKDGVLILDCLNLMR